MAILDTRALRARGAAAAEAVPGENRKLVLIYCGVMAALTLGSSGLTLILDEQIGGTGGLSGMHLRSVLQTLQTILYYINLIFPFFWSVGFLSAMIAMVRGRGPVPGDLTAGFRRFGRVLGYVAFQMLLVLALATASVSLAGLAFDMTPMGVEFAMLSAAEGVTEAALAEAAEKAMTPILIMTLLIFIPTYVYLAYGFRMSMYLLLERPIGAVKAHFESARLMRGHKWQMAKLDLGFWWYYALNLLITVVGYLDVLLPQLGIDLPWDGTPMLFATMVAYCLLQLMLFLWKKCPVEGTYVLAYEAIAAQEAQPEQPQT